jgi:BlaI family transcriptional regulator, penicillinase repressor
MRRKQKPTTLTRMELEVMQALWRTPGEAQTVRAALDNVNKSRTEPLAYTTVQTMLGILKDKGVVEAVPGAGRAHLFRSIVSRDQVAETLVDDLVERLFHGHMQPLLQHLVEREALQDGELRELKRWIESRLENEHEGP